MKGVLLLIALSGFFLLSVCELVLIIKDFKTETIGEPILDVELKSQKYNRTNYVLNGKTRILYPFMENVTLTTHLFYMKGSMKLNQVEIYRNRPVCEVIATDTYIWPQLVQNFGYPKSCPLELKEYEIKNFILNIDNIPQTVPDGQYQFETSYLLDNKVQQKTYILIHAIQQ